MSAQDPYAAFRRLPAGTFSYSAGGGEAMYDPVSGNYIGESNPEGWTTSQDFLSLLAGSPFQSKYTSRGFENLGDNRVGITLQQPGAHKYDTMLAEYGMDPATNEWVLQNNPMDAPTRQISSGEQFRDRAEQVAAAAAAAAAMYFGGGALMGAGGAGGAGAGAGAGAGSLNSAIAQGAYGGAFQGGGLGALSQAGQLGTALGTAGGAGSLMGSSRSATSGFWNGTDFSGTVPRAGSSNLGGMAGGNYLSRMASSPLGRYALTQGLGGLYSQSKLRGMNRDLRNTDPTSMPGYLAGERAVRRRMRASGYGGSTREMMEISDYAQREYDRFAANSRAQYQAETGALMNSLNVLGMLALGFGGG